MGTIAAVIVIAFLALWAVSCRRRLTVMEENVSSAMAQVGVQISSRFDALIALLELTRRYSAQESQALIETIHSRRTILTAASTPEEALGQEKLIAEALDRITAMARRYPELKASGEYISGLSAVDGCEKLVCTSRLIYNDSVTKLNRELRTFPASLLAGALGLRQRGHLEAAEDRAD